MEEPDRHGRLCEDIPTQILIPRENQGSIILSFAESFRLFFDLFPDFQNHDMRHTQFATYFPHRYTLKYFFLQVCQALLPCALNIQFILYMVKRDGLLERQIFFSSQPVLTNRTVEAEENSVFLGFTEIVPQMVVT